MLKRILIIVLIVILLPLAISCQTTEMSSNDEIIASEDISESNILSNVTFDQALAEISPVSDGSLNSNNNWVYYENSGGKGTAAVNDGQLSVTVEDPGQQEYAIQLLQSPVVIEEGTDYEIQLKAKADADLKMTIKVGGIAERQWTAYEQKTISLTNEMDDYSFEFKMDAMTDQKARVELWFLNEGEYTLDNIQLIKGETEQVETLEKPDLSFYTDETLTVDQKVDKIIDLMSLDEKIGQMVQAERTGISPAAVKKYKVGSLLSGGGSVPGDNEPTDWIEMYNTFQEQALATRLEIPIIYGVDSVHGHNNLKDATIFPHNIGLGAMGKGLLANDQTKDAKALMQKIGEITALETAATGIDLNFAPAVSVVRDLRWGRSYESYGEDPELQQLLVQPYITGLQGTEDVIGETKVLATAKHFIGDGGTQMNTGTSGYLIDRGNVELSLEELKRIHLKGYTEAIEADVGAVMASYNSYQGIKMHGNDLINDLLKDELGFDGVVISDWEGVDEIYAPIKYDKIVRSVNAGVDLFMEPHQWQEFIKNLKMAVENGDVTEARIDDALRRILTMKFNAGLFEQPYASDENIDTIGSSEHRTIAREAVRQSMVLLKNDHETLPFNAKENIYLMGDKANNLGVQCGGWTIEWQGFNGNDATQGTTIKDGLQTELNNQQQLVDSVDQADKIMVVIGEQPYTEGVGDSTTLGLSTDDRQILEKAINIKKPVVVVLLAGRPLIITDYVNQIDSLVMAWLPGTEGDGITDVLFGKYNFVGKLPVSWPKTIEQEPINSGDENYEPLFEYGYGLKMNIEK